MRKIYKWDSEHLKKQSISIGYIDFDSHSFNFLENLHFDELEIYKKIISQKRKREYILGRYCIKSILSQYYKEDLNEIAVLNGVFGQPIIFPNSHNLGVSLSHCENSAIAIVFPEAFPIGIDLENINLSFSKSISAELLKQEINILENFAAKRIDKKSELVFDEFVASLISQQEDFLSNKELLTIAFWSIKESLSKALKCGFTVPLSVLEIESIQYLKGCIYYSFKNFSQYAGISFCMNRYIISICYPKKIDEMKGLWNCFIS
ncbi:MAG: 4'-phosphopantetheinyl transferase superfamily protein [Parachlamydiales bacterium]